MAAFPVPGPQDALEQGVTGVMHPCLAEAIGSALALAASRSSVIIARITARSADERGR